MKSGRFFILLINAQFIFCVLSYIRTKTLVSRSFRSKFKAVPGYQLPDLSQSKFPNLPEQGYYDLIVIGSGPAGENCAVRAAQLGAKVAIIEKKSNFGGPTGLTSKAVREACKRICLAVDAIGIGDRKKKIKAIWKRLFPVLKTEAEVLQAVETRERLRKNGIDLYVGIAKFVSAHDDNNADEHLTKSCRLRVCRSTECIEMDALNVCICTGSRAYRPSELSNGVSLPFAKGKVLCSTEMGSLPAVPSSAAVIGGGVIAVEYATVLSELGVGVSLITKDESFLPFLEKGLRQSLRQRMKTKGHILFVEESIKDIQISNSSSTSSALAVSTGRHDAAVRVVLNTDRATNVNREMRPLSPPERVLKVDLVVFSGGRIANSDELDCANADINIGRYGQIEVDSHFRASLSSNVFAIGDVIGAGLASSAVWQGRRVAENIFKTPIQLEHVANANTAMISTSNQDDNDGFDSTTELDEFFSLDKPALNEDKSNRGSGEQDTLFGSSATARTGGATAGTDSPLTLWTIPEIASVGLSIDQAVERDPTSSFIEGFAYFNETARGRLSGDRDGYLKVVAKQVKINTDSPRKHAIIGVHIFGEGANELVQLGSILINSRSSLEQVSNTPFAAVTMTALFQLACDDALLKCKRIYDRDKALAPIV